MSQTSNLQLPIIGTIDIRNPDDYYMDTQNSLIMIIAGSQNTRLMNADPGASLERFLFENSIDEKLIRSIVEDQVRKYVPQVRILSFNVKNKKDNSIEFVIKWTIPSVTPERTQTLVIKKDY